MTEPRPRLLRTFVDAEQTARDWMRYWGFDDARLTGAGADGGIDVESSSAVAQVKAQQSPVGRPVVQQTKGAALDRQSLVFATGGYTPDALSWANSASVALFELDLSGTPTPVNEVARQLVGGFAAPVDRVEPKGGELPRGLPPDRLLARLGADVPVKWTIVGATARGQFRFIELKYDGPAMQCIRRLPEVNLLGESTLWLTHIDHHDIVQVSLIDIDERRQFWYGPRADILGWTPEYILVDAGGNHTLIMDVKGNEVRQSLPTLLRVDGATSDRLFLLDRPDGDAPRLRFISLDDLKSRPNTWFKRVGKGVDERGVLQRGHATQSVGEFHHSELDDVIYRLVETRRGRTIDFRIDSFSATTGRFIRAFGLMDIPEIAEDAAASGEFYRPSYFIESHYLCLLRQASLDSESERRQVSPPSELWFDLVDGSQMTTAPSGIFKEPDPDLLQEPWLSELRSFAKEMDFPLALNDELDDDQLIELADSYKSMAPGVIADELTPQTSVSGELRGNAGDRIVVADAVDAGDLERANYRCIGSALCWPTARLITARSAL